MCSPSFLGEHSVSYRPLQCTKQCCEDVGGPLVLAGPREASGRAWNPGRRCFSHLLHSNVLGIAQCKPWQCLDVFDKWGPKEPSGTCLGCRKERGAGIVPDCTECLGLDLAAKTTGFVLGSWHMVTVLPDLWLPSVSGSLFLSRWAIVLEQGLSAVLP